MKNLKLRVNRLSTQKYSMPELMSTSALKSAWRLLVLSGLTILSCEVSRCQVQPAVQGRSDTVRLCLLSDTQEPMFFERTYLTYNENAKARTSIFEKILALRPSSVIHLGDLVSVGSLDGSWEDVDQFVRRLREQDIEFTPIPGNHDYLLLSQQGISNFASRFPIASLTGYSRRYGNVAIVLVNSNFGKLSEEERYSQLHWYRDILMDFESDPSIDFVIVGCHHPPFTNSRIVSGSNEVRDHYLPEYYKSKKCRLFVSGHAHAYEHFRVNGKDFLVAGGSGGLQHPLRLGKEAQYQDVFSNSLEKRMFHFLTVESRNDTLAVELRMLRPDLKDFESFPQLKFARERTTEGEVRR